MPKKQCIGLLLAGGRGARLKELTRNIAKPVLPFGGKYRIVDFALSNCINSGIDTVGILTNYQSHTLLSYIGDGEIWGLNNNNGGLSFLPTYQSDKGTGSYEGTANAVYRNLDYIESYNPEYILIVSSDQIYKMDYSKMLKQHIETAADVTISGINVPWNEANRFGIMTIEAESNKIMEFEEKPSQPKSNLASMGIYIFNWKILRKYLEKDGTNSFSITDFGVDIIPSMLNDNLNLYAYRFNGYWKDVGTIESFWEANMDLLSVSKNPLLEMEEWTIYTQEVFQLPLYINKKANIQQSLISEGCKIFGRVENSVLFQGVTIGIGAFVKDSVILPGTVIGENAVIHRAVIGSGIQIDPNEKVGDSYRYSEVTLIGDNQTIQREIKEKMMGSSFNTEINNK